MSSVILKVLVKHVEEAYQLLNRSIIRVEQPDVTFDDVDDDVELEQMDTLENGIFLFRWIYF